MNSKTITINWRSSIARYKVSWKTKGKGADHKHFQVQSNKGNTHMPKMSNYDYTPEKIDEEAVKDEIKDEIRLLCRENIELNEHEINALASDIFNKLLREVGQGHKIKNWRDDVRKYYEKKIQVHD